MCASRSHIESQAALLLVLLPAKFEFLHLSGPNIDSRHLFFREFSLYEREIAPARTFVYYEEGGSNWTRRRI